MVGNFLAILRLFLLVICGCSWLNAQTVITGTVTDGTETLIGVAVREKGRDGGTLTDLDGRYDLSVSGPEAILVFTYVGKESQEITVGKRTEIDVVLRGTTALEQVVVTGYRGAQEVKDLVGSYAEVTETDLVADRPVESLDQLLEGRIAGVRVETVTGEPGLPIRVQIRGQGSLPDVNGNITASTQPLFVLDGVPLFDVSETTNNQASLFSSFNNQPLNPLALINADDIASITVLKDASATALYGADAANGVVLITTKTGAAGDQSISLSANFGTGQTINEIQFLDTRQYVELARETLFNSGQNPAESGSSTVETNWRNLVQRASTNADVDVAFSGGVAGVRYRVTAGYNELESVHRENGLRQGNLNLNLIFPVSDRFRITTRFSGAGQHKESLRSFEAFSFLPNVPVRLEDGSFNNDGFFARRPNPVALLEQNESYQDVFS
ncbi:MAG: TonB-dependent receptor plug domain-containing protein, partial [Bacteroidota bacterium]